MSFFAAAGAVVLCLGLAFVFLRPVYFLRAAGVRILTPFASVARSVGHIARPDASRETPESQREHLTAEEGELAILRHENESLRTAMALKDTSGVLVASAVRWYGNEGGKESLVIDGGKNRGIRAGDSVIDEERMLVGEVSEVGDDFSKVEVASNSGTTFAVSFASPAGSALARGIGARSFSVELVPEGAVVGEGDFVTKVIKNARGVAPVMAARIATVGSAGDFQTLRAVLLSHPERLDRVFVLITSPAP